MNSRWLKVLACLAIAAILVSSLAACAKEPEATKVVEEKGEAGPVQGGTLTLAVSGEPDMLDPHIYLYRHASFVAYQIFDRLVAIDQDYNLYPALAESWEVSDDGLTYTFNLRKDVKFHDGTPFNAEAVKYNFDRILEVPSTTWRDALGPYESTEIVDDYTVKLHFSKPHGPFLKSLGTGFSIMSPTAGEKWGSEEFGFHPVGTGPFKFVEWEVQSHLVVEKNPDYNWASDLFDHQGAPYLDKIEWRFVTEAGTRIGALETGEVDMVYGVPEFDVQRFRDDENFEVIKEMVPGFPTQFQINTFKSPTDDVRVRRALNLYLDRQRFVDTIYAGELKPSYGPLAENTDCYWPEAENLNAYDPDKAMELLKEVGWEDHDGDGILDKDGEKFHLDIYSCGDYTDPPEGIAAQFDEMGAETEIHMVPWAEQRRTGYEGLPNMLVVTFSSTDPRIIRLLLHTANEHEEGWMWTHFRESNPELQARLDEVLDLGEQTTESDKRCDFYVEAQKIIVENATTLPLKADYYIYAVTKRLHGWKAAPNAWPYFYDAWLEPKE